MAHIEDRETGWENEKIWKGPNSDPKELHTQEIGTYLHELCWYLFVQLGKSEWPPETWFKSMSKQQSWSWSGAVSHNPHRDPKGREHHTSNTCTHTHNPKTHLHSQPIFHTHTNKHFITTHAFDKLCIFTKRHTTSHTHDQSLSFWQERGGVKGLWQECWTCQ